MLEHEKEFQFKTVTHRIDF